MEFVKLELLLTTSTDPAILAAVETANLMFSFVLYAGTIGFCFACLMSLVRRRYT